MILQYVGIRTECEAKALPKSSQIVFVGYKRNTSKRVKLYECVLVHEDTYTYGKKNLRELHKFFTSDWSNA